MPRDGALRPIACPRDEPPMRVSELIDQSTRQWDMVKLNEYFLPLDVEVIKSIPISTRMQSDFWAWHYDKRGLFSVRSAYRMISSTKQRREAWLEGTAANSDVKGREKSWTSLWKIKAPAKVKMFLWRLAKQSLPTSDVLHHRHILASSTCGICGADDSWRHSLLDCTMARCVWALADEDMTEHMNQVQEAGARTGCLR